MAATDQICQLDTITLAGAVAAKELSPVEAVEAVLERLDRLDPTLHMFTTVVADQARVLNNIIFLLDVSGSMSASFGDGTRSDKASAAIVEFSLASDSPKSEYKGGTYCFDAERLHQAHQWNQWRAEQALKLGVPFIVIDNTNSRAK